MTDSFYETFTCRSPTPGSATARGRPSPSEPTYGDTHTCTPRWYAEGSATVTCTGTGFFGKVSSGSASW